MGLTKVTDRVYYYPFDDAKDRPILGYIRGDGFSVAVDAGHSAAHVQEFYSALRAQGLALPALTVITHWHWDHTLGMHAVSGKTMASRRTNAHLKELIENHKDDLDEYIRSVDAYAGAEYPDGEPVIAVPADIVYEDSSLITAGRLEIEVMEAPSSHTDDTTLVYVPSEKCLFLGDSVLGEFPDWKIDWEKMNRLIARLEALDFEYALSGHWKMQTKDEVLADMRAGIFD